MPTFDTPEPIFVQLELGGAGSIRLVASDRSDTAVEVHPSNPADRADVAAAEQTRVDYADGRLSVRARSAGWRYYTPWAGRGTVDVEIALPAGSRLDGQAGMGTFRCEGRFAELSVKTGFGEIRLEHAGAVLVRSGQGNVSVEHAAGRAEISTGGGRLQVARVDGPAAVRNSNGDIWLGEVAGELRAKTANGRIMVDRSQSAVSAQSANGDVVIGAVERGEVVAETACGLVEIGVADGVLAWLELRTGHGNVRNELDRADAPGPGEEAVEIRARTGYGDITIRRALDVRAATAH